MYLEQFLKYNHDKCFYIDETSIFETLYAYIVDGIDDLETIIVFENMDMINRMLEHLHMYKHTHYLGWVIVHKHDNNIVLTVPEKELWFKYDQVIYVYSKPINTIISDKTYYIKRAKHGFSRWIIYIS